MILIPAKSMKVGKQYYTRIGKYCDRVVIVKIIRTRVRKYAYVRRVGSKKVLPKLRIKLDLWIRSSQ
jgi:hypothetical protein